MIWDMTDFEFFWQVSFFSTSNLNFFVERLLWLDCQCSPERCSPMEVATKPSMFWCFFNICAGALRSTVRYCPWWVKRKPLTCKTEKGPEAHIADGNKELNPGVYLSRCGGLGIPTPIPHFCHLHLSIVHSLPRQEELSMW